jgi:Putative peptidoglycan binding domain/L,D-transpeptidase catalytic domain
MRRWPGAALALPVVMLAAACGSGGGPAAHGRTDAAAKVAKVAHSHAPAPKPAPVHRAAPAHPATVVLDVHRRLSLGMSGRDVRQVQRRLAALRYYPGPADGRFGPDLLEAVWAFEEVQGLRTTGVVSRAMLRALAHPRAPKVLVPRGGKLRVEVNLAREVLVLYRGGKVALISHVSSGGGYYYCSPGGGCGYAITPTGNFRTITFMPGWVVVPLGEMYNPVFFIGHAYAIHGDTDVPLQPASHGCVRIPMDIAAFFHTLLPDTGTPVYVRG